MILEFVNDQMRELGVPYRYWEWGENPPETYFVGEFVETTTMSEDGETDGTLTLSGFTRGTYSDLQGYRDLIFDRFRNGETGISGGQSCAIYYNNAMSVPTGLEHIKRMDITLDTKEWSE